jgi:MFS family permease
MADLFKTFSLDFTALGHLTSAVQFGFIAGSLLYALLSIADRFSPSKVFFISALFGALFNLGMTRTGNTAGSLSTLRFLTGFSLAGIYPVGMKIASDYYQKGLETSLGFLVGALVLGTAFPHLLKAFTGAESLPWKLVLITTSLLAIIGGIIILFFVPNGPYRKPMLKKDFSAFIHVFKVPDFKSAAIGYFGHMWELYAFWAFIPVILVGYESIHPVTDFNIPLLSFLVIGSGAISCVAGGFISRSLGVRKTAGCALFLSGLCCLLSPFIFLQDQESLLIIFLIFWGMVVVADSPLFSTLVANNAPATARGTGLTMVNSIGFAITIISIELINLLVEVLPPVYLFLFLAPGPITGLILLFRKGEIIK